MRYWFICAEDTNWIAPARNRKELVDKYERNTKNADVYFIEEIFEGDLDLYTEAQRIE